MFRKEIDFETGTETIIQLTDEEVQSAIHREQERLNAVSYAEKRALAYPSFADQFDSLFHGGYEVWKASIQVVKDKYPKP